MSDPKPNPLSVKSGCTQCGMSVGPIEYHPYAACLMFAACRNSQTVRSNLSAVRAYGWREACEECACLYERMWGKQKPVPDPNQFRAECEALAERGPSKGGTDAKVSDQG